MTEVGWLGIKVSEWIMIGAILLGPILAVWVTRYHDSRREKQSRQLSVLRSLIKTRQIRLDAEHVGALNLIEVEFYGVEKIISAYEKYIGHLSSDLPAPAAQDSYFQTRQGLFFALLHVIGEHLGYSFDKLDLGQRSYMPVAWGDDQERIRKNAALLTELLEGKRSLPVFTLHAAQGLFPAPPEKNSEEAR
jgi:uncharacterized protein DUF6680